MRQAVWCPRTFGRCYYYQTRQKRMSWCHASMANWLVVPSLYLYQCWRCLCYISKVKGKLNISILGMRLKTIDWRLQPNLQFFTSPVLTSEYPGQTRSIPCSLMLWLLVTPCYQQVWCQLCEVRLFLVFQRVNNNDVSMIGDALSFFYVSYNMLQILLTRQFMPITKIIYISNKYAWI